MAAKRNEVALTISEPNIQHLILRVVGTSPYLQARFGAKAQQAMRDKMVAGSTAKKGVQREARDFDRDFREAQHRSEEGWVGIPASAFRNAMIDACRMVGFEMTRAKMSVFVEADGLDSVDGTPLIRLDAGEPERSEMITRNSGPGRLPDIRVRPMWRAWAARVTLTYDADQFTANDVANLLRRAGIQVGIGEGRPFSKMSAGLGFGRFDIATA